jgi:uroporphyrin-III C-methyltransferase
MSGSPRLSPLLFAPRTRRGESWNPRAPLCYLPDVIDPKAYGLPVFEPGWVWLVGAGPGDPGLLTLHGLGALAQADVVVYDALVDPRIIAMARPGAVLEYAGKRGGKPSPKQRDISARLVERARAGQRVLRLKGGDPFVFGRGGEEALTLVEAGIPFRVVPGVTAGIGGLGYAGIPVTHRDTNHAVTFVTGHGVTGEVPDGMNWRALCDGAPVLVLYMGLKHLSTIAARLMEAGKPAGEPVAIVSRATTERQVVLETTLGRAERDAREAGIEPPTIVVIGEVVRLRQGLDWLGALGGRRLDPDPLGLSRDRDSA